MIDKQKLKSVSQKTRDGKWKNMNELINMKEEEERRVVQKVVVWLIKLEHVYDEDGCSLALFFKRKQKKKKKQKLEQAHVGTLTQNDMHNFVPSCIFTDQIFEGNY